MIEEQPREAITQSILVRLVDPAILVGFDRERRSRASVLRARGRRVLEGNDVHKIVNRDPSVYCADGGRAGPVAPMSTVQSLLGGAPVALYSTTPCISLM